MIIRRLAATLLIAAALTWLFYSAPAKAESQFAAQNGWEQQAERELFLPQGMAGQLMTQEEWQKHQQQMQDMTDEQREQYRQQSHKKMMQRAKDRGLNMPQVPPGHGTGGGMMPAGGIGSRSI